VGLFRTPVSLLARAPGLGVAVRWCMLRTKYFTHEVMQRAGRREHRPRDWSNQELKKIAPLVHGDIINVSGWQDSDKRGGKYRDYFPNARSYSISNYHHGEKGVQGSAGEIALDLEADAPHELVRRFDVVFNHTVLEHIFDVHQAVKTLCALSRELVIVVTPFVQEVHFIAGSFGDWWRMTPACMRRLLERQGLTTVYQSVNDTAWFEVYVFTVAVRDPENYRGPRASVSDLGIGNRVLRRAK